MKKHHGLTLLGVIMLAIAIDNLYEHPTYGNGLQALYALIKAGLA